MAKSNFTVKDYDKNEAKNYHATNALELVKKYGTKAELKKIESIVYRRHRLEETSFAHEYYKNLEADEAESKKKKRKGDKLM
jgi:hypothetical protein